MAGSLFMGRIINISGLRVRLSEFVRMAEAGEQVLVCRRKLPVARLVPLAVPRSSFRPLSGIRGWLDDDDVFQQQLEERRTRVRQEPRRNLIG
jgi:antitoxin (DNA-binding transcriptional repressor) of toxin-antitoxin stability system